MQANDENNPAHQLFNYDTAQTSSSSSTSPPGHNPQNIAPNGYPGYAMNPVQPGNSGMPNFNHSYHVHGAPNHPHFHPANLAPAGYMPHAAGASQVNHQGHGELHHWYQGYHPSSANPYYMQNDQYNVWHHMFSSDYMDILSGNMLQNHQNNHQYGQNANRVLPSPNSTSSMLSRSGPSSPEMELRAGGINNFPGDPRNFEGAQGIRSVEESANRARIPGRPGPIRAEYEWMNKKPYQSAQNNGKTRTKDKYRVVYSDNQRMELEKVFTFHNKYITIRQKSELAVTLGLSERQVKIWFQNRRAKERKQTKKRLEEKAAQEARHISPHNFPNMANFAEPIRNPQLSSATALAMQQNQPVNVLTSGGLLTPPTASEDVLAPSCSYATPHINPHFKKESDDHSR